MDKREEKLEAILSLLHSKASVKQAVYRNTLSHFSDMKKIALSIVEELTRRIAGLDRSVEVKYRDSGQFEFQVKLSGDLVVFSMHSNVVTFPDEHLLSSNDYIQAAPRRRYFGALMVYNFLADSLKYNRLNDEGYLIARMFINIEDHFYIEGVRQLNFLYPDITNNVLNNNIFREFIESALIASMDNDSVMTGFEMDKTISVGQKLHQSMVGSISKVGFEIKGEKQDTKYLRK